MNFADETVKSEEENLKLIQGETVIILIDYVSLQKK